VDQQTATVQELVPAASEKGRSVEAMSEQDGTQTKLAAYAVIRAVIDGDHPALFAVMPEDAGEAAAAVIVQLARFAAVTVGLEARQRGVSADQVMEQLVAQARSDLLR
jgi:hypothetical protein